MNESLELPRQIRKFNPGTLQSDEEVIRQFVVRKPKLGIVLEVLRGNIDSSSCQHVLLVAPRGRGKSMLLARVAAELRSNREFSERLLPVRFMEESQEIFDLTDFWLESLFYLAKASKVCDPELAQELQDVHADLTAEWRGQDLEERARATVLEAADRLGRKLVLMVENLQALCGNVDDDFGWKLRGALQSEPQIILLATATSRFKGLDDASEPFFELFRIIRLEPLDTEECRLLWQVVSGDAVSGREIRPLEILTGGDPRLLVIVAEFARHRSLRELMEELVSLIDDHTEYFRAHLEGFAKTERRIYLAVIDLWQPSSTGEIAARARMDVRSASTLLGRLVGREVVTPQGSGKKRMYAATQRLYSIYYKLRRERDEAAVVRNLIHFMAVFYTETELADMAGQISLEAVQWPAIREGIERAIAEAPQIGRIFSAEELQGTKQAFEQVVAIDDKGVKLILREIMAAAGEHKDRHVIEIVDQFFAFRRVGSPHIPEPAIALVLWAKAVAHGNLGENETAIATYDQVVELFGDSDDPEILVPVATALVNRGVAQGWLGATESEVVTYDDVVGRFGSSDVPELQVQVAMALFNKAVTQGQIGEPQAEMATYDEVVERFGDSGQPELQVHVANALFNKAITQGQIGEAQAEMATYDKTIERFGDSDLPDLQIQVAKALVNKAVTQGQIGEAQAEMATYDETIERFGDSDLPGLQVQVAKALVNKAVTQGQVGEAQAEMATYDETIERFGDSDVPDLQVQVAKALVNKAVTQGQIGEAQAEMATYDETIERFGDSDVHELQVPVAKALVNKAVAQGQIGEAQAAMATYGETIERFGDSDVHELQVPVAMALFNKAITQGQIGEAQAEMATYDEMVERFGDSDMPELQVPVAKALVNKAVTQVQIGEAQAAIATCGTVVACFKGSDAPEITIQVARALWVKTKALLVREEPLAAMETFRSMYAAFVPGHEIVMRQLLALVPDLLAAGVSEHELIEILSSDSEKASTIVPLVIALRQRTGEVVRAPSEVLEVAADIREEIDAKAETADAAPPTSRSTWRRATPSPGVK